MEKLSENKIGLIYAFLAFSLWGMMPIYFKEMQHILPFEILAHRVIWSVVLLFFLLLITRGFSEVKKIFKNKKTLATLFLTSILIATNWFIYIYAISINQITQASLGYFINPIVNIFLGIFFLKEKLAFAEKIAVGLASFAILLQIVLLGEIPYLSLGLAFSFGFYALIKKKLIVNSFAGLFIETFLIAPIALFYIYFLINAELSHFHFSGINSSFWLLLSSGPITVIPLLFFTSAAKRLRLGTIGFIQYLAPTIVFFLAIFAYNEPISFEKLTTFIFIWLSLVIVSINSLKTKKRKNNV